MKYEYDKKLFSKDQNLIISLGIDKGLTKEQLDFITKINSLNQPVFYEGIMKQIYTDFRNGCSINNIKIYAKTVINEYGNTKVEETVFDGLQTDLIRLALKQPSIDKEKIELITRLNKNNKPIYNCTRMDKIVDGIVRGFSLEQINLYAKLNKNGEPIYNAYQMDQIIQGLIIDLSKEQIELYAQLNENMEPIFESDQMSEIRWAFIDKYPEEKIHILTTIKDGKPLFEAEAMERVKEFLYNADKKHVKQLKECINENLSFDALSSLMNNKLPIEHIRIYRDLYKLGYNRQQIGKIESKNFNYEELKEIKYLATCAEKIGYIDKFTNVNFQTKGNVDLLKDELLYIILTDSSNWYVPTKLYEDKASVDVCDLLRKCLSYKLEPDVIGYMLNIDNSLNAKGMEIVAIGYLNGLSVEEIDKARGSVSRSTSDFKTAIENAVRNKYGDISDIDNEIEFKTNWFEEIENER